MHLRVIVLRIAFAGERSLHQTSLKRLDHTQNRPAQGIAVEVKGLLLPDENATLEAGARLAGELSQELVFLHGDLGAGKTTLVRGLLRSWGYLGTVKSPTYTLVEPYEIAGRSIYHFDFYRIKDPEELSYIGIDDLLRSDGLKLVEWAARGASVLPKPELEIELGIVDRGRVLNITDHRD